MHIKHIHETIEKLSKYACDEACKSVEEIDTKELGEVVDMVKDLSEAEYYSRISKAMEESEKEDEEEAKRIMREMKEQYGEEEGERRFYDNYRYANGRFAPKGRGTRRRGYAEPLYHMPMDYDYDRDLDRMTGNRMYYSGGGSNGGSNGGNMSGGNMNGSGNMGGNSSRGYSDGYSDGMRDGSRRDGREGRSGRSRRTYMETKEMNRDNTSESKQRKMKDLEAYMTELSGDITEMINDASAEEKSLLKQKLQVLTQKIS